MGAIAWGKALGRRRADRTIASATTINVPAGAMRIRLTGTTKVDFVKAGGKVGRPLIIEGSADGSVALDNVNDAATEGQMDLGGSDITLGGPKDSVMLRMTADRAWQRVIHTDL